MSRLPDPGDLHEIGARVWLVFHYAGEPYRVTRGVVYRVEYGITMRNQYVPCEYLCEYREPRRWGRRRYAHWFQARSVFADDEKAAAQAMAAELNREREG